MMNFLGRKPTLATIRFKSKTPSIQDANPNIFLIKILIPTANLQNTTRIAQQKTIFSI